MRTKEEMALAAKILDGAAKAFIKEHKIDEACAADAAHEVLMWAMGEDNSFHEDVFMKYKRKEQK